MMLVYIVHNDKINVFRLSDEVSGKYLISDIDRFNNKRNLVNVAAQNGKWYIYDNENVKITYNNQQCSSIELALYNTYQLTVLGSELITLYVVPSYDSTFFIKEIIDNVDIIVGTGGKSDIIYNENIAVEQIKLSYNNGIYKFTNLNPKIPVYVNRVRKTSCVIHNFDTIFVLGLKIIVCNNKLFINNPLKKVNMAVSNKYKNYEEFYIVGNKETDVRSFTNFYEENDYYAKSPLFKSQVKPFELTITEPPAKAARDKSSVLMTVIPTLLMTFTSLITTMTSIKSFRSGDISKDDLMVSLIMCLAMIVTGIVWPFVEKFYTNMTVFFSNVQRLRKYKKYLKKKEKILEEEVKTQKMAYVVNNISLSDCKKVIESRSPELFNRDYDSDDFLNVRLGIGDVELKGNISYTKPDYIADKDILLDEVDRLLEKYKYIKDVPYTISLSEKNSIAFIMNDKDLYDTYMSGIILQLLTFHSYYDLKLVVLTDENLPELSYLKDSNHCWSDDRSFRYYATTVEEAQLISTNLERELNIRKSADKDRDKSAYRPYYLIVSNCINKYRNLNIINDILNLEEKMGLGLLMYDTKISNIPSGCINFVNLTSEEGNVFQSNMNGMKKFKPEFVTDFNIDVDYCSRLISNIPINNNNSAAQNLGLPESIGFLQMCEVGNVEQLNCAIRWENSNPANSLSVPVGVDVNGNYVTLDLHEKNHGPHGLIAGMTGSGKSEFIITYILSLAINYKPEEVQFLLIDYKGGGLAGAFENRKEGVKLPHLVGTITNLDTAEMKRTLVSIKSELQRRQKIFNEAKEFLDTGNIDIYKYQKLHREGILKQPLSHLFIICDEFAELKAQQPDFMDELVSAARIGRSLGIHLILATQKPSGVVDEQIWSNSKFKVCCKVQTSDDSNEMIRRPDAAYLKESGRFYLQVGYDELFMLGQSAYSGMPYIPSETIVSKIDNNINIIGNTGEIIRNISKKEDGTQKREDNGEELINILKYIIRVANENNYKYQQLWLDNIPPIIYYDYLVKKYGITPSLYNIEPVIGEYDDPKNQKQGIVTLPFKDTGNVFICGSSGNGKNTLMSTMIYSTIINHNCSEVNIYILDFGTEKLTKFRKAPQVGDVLTIVDTDKIKYLFYMLEDIKNERQKYYSENGGDFDHDILNKKCPFPTILVFIYELEVFKETFEDLYDDNFAPFTRNCAKFGIYFIVSSTSTSALGFMVENNFPKKIALNMVDSTDYAMLFDTSLIPSKNPGRGLIEVDDDVFEFQVPMVFDEKSSSQKLNYVFEQLDKFLKNKARPVPTIPDVVNVETIGKVNVSLDRFPVGVNLMTAQTSYFNFNTLFNLVLSSKNNDGMSFMNSIIRLSETIPNKKIIVFNGVKDYEMSFDENIKYYNSGFKKMIPIINDNITKYNSMTESENEFIVFILGYNRISKILEKAKEEDENLVSLDEVINNSKNNKFFKFIVFDTAASFDEVSRGDIANFVDDSVGIWVGRGFDNQSCFDTTGTYIEGVSANNDTAVLLKNGRADYTKFIRM